MVYFQTEKLGKFWRASKWKRLEYLMAIRQLCKWQLGIFSPVLVYCVKKNLATLNSNTKIWATWVNFKIFSEKSPNLITLLARQKKFERIRKLLCRKQGDQMCLWKKSPNIKPYAFLCQNLNRTCTMEKVALTICATCVVFENCSL
jgi:hypothetical protein